MPTGDDPALKASRDSPEATPAVESPDIDESATRDESPPTKPARRRRHCDNCGTRMRGRFCIACGQRDHLYDTIKCENCGAEKQGLFCAVCGQNDRNYRRTIFPVLGEMIGEAFETDSRLFRTLRVLFTKPGFLSTEFSRNRRASYLSPFRLYLFTSIAFFFTLSIAVDLPDGPPLPGTEREGPGSLIQIGPPDGDGETSVDLSDDDGGETEASRAEADGPIARLRRGRGVAAVDVDDVASSAEGEVGSDADGTLSPLTAEQLAAVDRLRHVLDPRRKRKLDEMLERPLIRQSIANAAAGVPAETLQSIDDLGLYIVSQLIDVFHRPWDAVKAWVENLPIAMFCLLPFYALLLKVVYPRPRRYYSEHLVFGMHIHTVAYMVFTAEILLPDIAIIEWGELVLLVAMAVYYFMALKGYYGGSNPVTLAKYLFLTTCYVALLAIALGGAGAAVLLLF